MTAKQTRIGKGLTAIYVRRSVADRDNNSLSIEAQKEDCLRFIGADCAYQIYCDNKYLNTIQFNLFPYILAECGYYRKKYNVHYDKNRRIPEIGMRLCFKFLFHF